MQNTKLATCNKLIGRVLSNWFVFALPQLLINLVYVYKLNYQLKLQDTATVTKIPFLFVSGGLWGPFLCFPCLGHRPFFWPLTHLSGPYSPLRTRFWFSVSNLNPHLPSRYILQSARCTLTSSKGWVMLRRSTAQESWKGDCPLRIVRTSLDEVFPGTQQSY